MWHQEAKLLLEAYIGVDRDALHVHIALLLYFVVLLAFRLTWKSSVPWLVVLTFTILNEALDMWEQSLAGTDLGWADAWRGGRTEAVKDLWNTMLWPSLLLLIGGYTTLFERCYRSPLPAADQSQDAPEQSAIEPLSESGETQ